MCVNLSAQAISIIFDSISENHINVFIKKYR